jgi:6-phosphogluconolactonase/glucosamine-6-phosphate isomerase/deaminase
MEVITSNNPKRAAAAALSQLLAEQAGNPVLLMLSGGSALLLLDEVSTDDITERVTITVLDERFSTDPTINNFSQLEHTAFYRACVEYGAHSISTVVLSDETIEDVRDRFAAALYTWKTENPDGVVIATMGIGADGHTAGILPGTYVVDMNGPAWVVGYQVPVEVNPYTERVTVTNTFLRQCVDVAIVFAVGKEKRPYFARIEAGDYTLETIPAGILNEMRAVNLFTD